MNKNKRIEVLEERIKVLESSVRVRVGPEPDSNSIFWTETAKVNHVVRQILNHLGLEVGMQRAEESVVLVPITKNKKKS